MHALRHVHGLLTSSGTMLDLHPVTDEHVEAGGRQLGVIEEPEFVAELLPNAESAVREVIAAGLYSLEAEAEFDFLRYFGDADELVAAHEDPTIVQPALLERIRAARPPLVIREHVVLRRLRVRSRIAA